MKVHKAILTWLMVLQLLSIPVVSARTIAQLHTKTSSVTVTLPCSVILRPVDKTLTPNTYGVALVSTFLRTFPTTPPRYQERTSISVLVNRLPKPSTYGDFDGYEGFAQIPGKISWSFTLLPRQEFQLDTTWAGRFDEISAVLTPNTRVQVRPYNSKHDKLGAVILENTLEDCHRVSTATSMQVVCTAFASSQ